jgi:hypothetical protein
MGSKYCVLYILNKCVLLLGGKECILFSEVTKNINGKNSMSLAMGREGGRNKHPFLRMSGWKWRYRVV